MRKRLYKGYSSISTDGVNTNLEDINLIKQDLMNHFYTKSDDRVFRPKYGSIIWDLHFDLSDEHTETLILKDISRIIGLDPRVNLIRMVPLIDVDRHEIFVDVLLWHVEYESEFTLNLNFKSS